MPEGQDIDALVTDTIVDEVSHAPQVETSDVWPLRVPRANMWRLTQERQCTTDLMAQ